jgi:hypothetical protein
MGAVRGPRERLVVRLVALALAGLAAVGVLTRAGADDEPRVIAVAPARTGELVVCRLTTAGLPGERLVQSMRSGLVSAVDLEVALLDAGRRPVHRGRLTLQLAFDLWEEVFAVRGGGNERRFADLAALRSFLGELDTVPVAPLDLLREGERYRVRVGLRLHPIAPSQRQRVADAIAGQQRPRHPGQDQQETTVSLGQLIRLFYDEGDEPARGEALSPWFTPEELRRAPH